MCYSRFVMDAYRIFCGIRANPYYGCPTSVVLADCSNVVAHVHSSLFWPAFFGYTFVFYFCWPKWIQRVWRDMLRLKLPESNLIQSGLSVVILGVTCRAKSCHYIDCFQAISASKCHARMLGVMAQVSLELLAWWVDPKFACEQSSSLANTWQDSWKS